MTTTGPYIRSLDERGALVPLILLLCGDLVLSGMHFVEAFAPTSDSLFDIEKDGGYPEIYQYLKFASTAVLWLLVALKKRTIHYVAWTLVFTYFLLDDSLLLHERGGSHVAAIVGLVPALGLRPRDIGELAVSATVGILLSVMLAWAYRSGTQEFRKISRDIALLVLVLVFFGVGVDMVREAINPGWQFAFTLGVIEEGGEMLSASLILWYTFVTDTRGGDDDFDGARPHQISTPLTP